MVMPSGELHIRHVGPSDANHSYRCKTRHRLTDDIRTSSTSGRLVLSSKFNFRTKYNQIQHHDVYENKSE